MEEDNKQQEINYKKYLDDHPLLEKFRQLAPGSYSHCQNVVNIIEPIAKELNLNVDLMKVCGFYHDIGKMYNPLYFSENQSSKENIHDELLPHVSCRFITGHLSDGVMILTHNDFPKNVIEIISEHHGDTIIKQFHKSDLEAPEDNYRYKSRKPTTTEAVVLMLTDSVEAMSRSEFIKRDRKEENGDFIRRSVQATIDRFDDDDQLDKIVHGVIKQIKRILIRELESIYHKRVSYDSEKEID